MAKLSIAVLSDLHFCASDAGRKHTHAILSENLPPKQDPFADFLALIDSEGLKADVLLTPGDLTTMSCRPGLRAAWAAIQEIAGKMGAELVVASTGNHDVSSREKSAESEPEMWEALKQLKPTYPSPQADELQRLQYWAEHFLILERDWIQVVSLNSCNCHARGEKEYEKGRVTEYTVQVLQEKLAKGPKKKLNILLCHHHPSGLPELRDTMPDYSEMQHGNKLLSMLDDAPGSWLVIHGHKHLPHLDYAKGGSDSPVVLSCGSFSAALPAEFLATASNQAYIIEIDEDVVSKLGAAGVIRSWDWVKGAGWAKAERFDSSRKDRIIHGSGFGNRTSIVTVAANIRDMLDGNQVISWKQVIERYPDLEYMRVDDRIKLLKHLKDYKSAEATDEDPMNPGDIVLRSAT